MTAPGPSSGEPRSSVARHSLTVAAGAAVSRASGLARMAVAAAVLGPTFLANIYSTTTLLPGMIYQMMAGPLIAAIIIPPLVKHLDRGDHRSASRLANASLGLILTGFLGAVVLALVASPLLVQLLVIGSPPDVKEHSEWVASMLLMMMIPQLLLNGLIGVAISAQQARGRFGFPAVAQIFENVGVMAVLLFAHSFVQPGQSADAVGVEFVLLIGLGTTAATALQALAQWLGARSVGLTLWPTWHWGEPDVKEILGLALPSVGTATIGTLRYFTLVIVAGLIPGGVIAMQLGVQFGNLPVALGAQPISQALLPHLSRLRAANDPRAFEEYRHAVAMALWIAIPAMLGLLVLSGPIARAVAFGEMANERGIELVSVAIASYSLAILGLSVATVAGQAVYSSRDALGAFQHAVLRTALAIPTFAIAAFWATGATTLIVLGVGSAIAETAAAIFLDRRMRAGEVSGEASIVGRLARVFVLASVAVAVAWGVEVGISDLAPGGRVAALVALLAAAMAGFAIYVLSSLAVGAPELAGLGIRRSPRFPWLRRESAPLA